MTFDVRCCNVLPECHASVCMYSMVDVRTRQRDSLHVTLVLWLLMMCVCRFTSKMLHVERRLPVCTVFPVVLCCVGCGYGYCIEQYGGVWWGVVWCGVVWCGVGCVCVCVCVRFSECESMRVRE